jgi:hypothetical protein
MYIAFNTGTGAHVTSSTDGDNWSLPVQVTNDTTIQGWQLTGAIAGNDGTVFLLAVRNPQENRIYRSTDEGGSWQQFVIGAP